MSQPAPLPLLYPLATASQLALTPSRKDGIPEWLELSLRAEGARMIQQAGILVDSPQVVMATAQVLFQRFWYITSMRDFSISQIAMGALYLASKLEEHILRMRDIINTFDLLLSRTRRSLSHSITPHPLTTPKDPNLSSEFSYTPISYYSNEYYESKDLLIVGEMQLLKRLGFGVRVELPYNAMVNYLNVLGLAGPSGRARVGGREGREGREGKEGEGEEGKGRSVVEVAWGVLNDLLQTPCPATHPSHTLAATSIHLACRTLSIPLPEPPEQEAWYELFDVERGEIGQVEGWVMGLYRGWEGVGLGEEGGEEVKERVTERERERERRRREVRGMLLGGKREVRRWLEEHAAKDELGDKR